MTAVRDVVVWHPPQAPTTIKEKQEVKTLSKNMSTQPYSASTCFKNHNVYTLQWKRFCGLSIPTSWTVLTLDLPSLSEGRMSPGSVKPNNGPHHLNKTEKEMDLHTKSFTTQSSAPFTQGWRLVKVLHWPWTRMWEPNVQNIWILPGCFHTSLSWEWLNMHELSWIMNRYPLPISVSNFWTPNLLQFWAPIEYHALSARGWVPHGVPRVPGTGPGLADQGTLTDGTITTSVPVNWKPATLSHSKELVHFIFQTYVVGVTSNLLRNNQFQTWCYLNVHFHDIYRSWNHFKAILRSVPLQECWHCYAQAGALVSNCPNKSWAMEKPDPQKDNPRTIYWIYCKSLSWENPTH